jgi:hypothetical protein
MDNPEPSTDPDDGPSDDAKNDLFVSAEYLLVNRLLFPTLCFVFAVVYLNAIWDFGWRSRYYPVFVTGTMIVLSVSIYATEIQTYIRGYEASSAATFVESAQDIWNRWNLSVLIGLISVAYLGLIEPIGFYPSSLITMVVIMLVSGIRDPKQLILIPIVFLAVIYALFTIGIDMAPPAGPLGL